jgi:hypothetical protein
VYTAKLTVITEDGEQNSIEKEVFMGQKDAPVVARAIKA